MLSVYLWPAILGYLLGSFPTGYLVGRSRGIDIREHGSGNIGATNVVRVLGKKLGYFVFVCDVLKGLFAVQLGTLLGAKAGDTGTAMLLRDSFSIAAKEPLSGNAQAILTSADHRTAALAAIMGIIAALACILGHNFPVWLRFKGGKGVATTVGVLLGLMPAAIGVAAVIWTACFYLSRYVSLASLLGAASLPVTVWFLTNRHGNSGFRDPLFWFSAAAAALIFWRHRVNIARLLDGTETRFERRPKPVPPAP